MNKDKKEGGFLRLRHKEKRKIKTLKSKRALYRSTSLKTRKKSKYFDFFGKFSRT